MERGFVETAIPCAGNRSVRVASAGNDISNVLFAIWCIAGTGGVGYYVHSHGFADACSFQLVSLCFEDRVSHEGELLCLPMAPYPKTPSLCPTQSLMNPISSWLPQICFFCHSTSNFSL